MRRTRGSMMVEVALTLPVVAVLVGTVEYFRQRSLGVLTAMHAAQTDAWRRAMANGGNGCAAAGAPNGLNAVGLGVVGDQARTLVRTAMPSLTFTVDSGGAHAQVAIPALHAPWPFSALRLSLSTRADFMPCNETVQAKDGALPPAYDDLWHQHAGPSS